jgi:predicted transcriptional regulator
MSDSGISIELTSTQVEEVVGGTAGRSFVSELMRGLADRDTPPPSYRSLAESPRLSRSLLLGLLVLASFPADGRSLAVTEVAESVEMSASTTHRYLVTLLAVGLLTQDSNTRRYSVPVGGDLPTPAPR